MCRPPVVVGSQCCGLPEKSLQRLPGPSAGASPTGAAIPQDNWSWSRAPDRRDRALGAPPLHPPLCRILEQLTRVARPYWQSISEAIKPLVAFGGRRRSALSSSASHRTRQRQTLAHLTSTNLWSI